MEKNTTSECPSTSSQRRCLAAGCFHQDWRLSLHLRSVGNSKHPAPAREQLCNKTPERRNCSPFVPPGAGGVLGGYVHPECALGAGKALVPMVFRICGCSWSIFGSLLLASVGGAAVVLMTLRCSLGACDKVRSQMLCGSHAIAHVQAGACVFLGGSSFPSSSGQRMAHGGFLGREHQPTVA